MKYNFCAVLLTLLVMAAAVASEPKNPISSHAAKADQLYDAGNYRAARVEFSKALSQIGPDDPGKIMLEYKLASSAARSADADALDLLLRFEFMYPHTIYGNDINFEAANLLYNMGDYKNALMYFDFTQRFELGKSKQEEYDFKYGHTNFQMGDYQAAARSLRQVSPQSEFYIHARYFLAYSDYVSGNYSAAKSEFIILRDYPAYSPVIPYYLLQIEFLEGNYDYVIREGAPLYRAAATDARRAEIARIMAESYFHYRDYPQAYEYIGLYQRAGGEMDRQEYYIKGYSEYMLNDIGEAVINLGRVVGPNDRLTQNAAYHLADAYLRSGDKFKAMQSFSMAAEADFDDTIREDALFNYGKLQYELGGGVFNEAVNVLNRYISEYPNSPRVEQAREYLAAAYYNSRDYDAAYEMIRLIPNPDNNVKTAYQKIAYFRGLQYMEEGNTDRAYELLEESYRFGFNPKYTALTQFWKGEVEYSRGNYEKAIPLYREYLNLAPATEREYSFAQYNLGYSLFNLNRWSESRQSFERFISARPTQDSYRADALNRIGDTYYAGRNFTRAVENYDAAIRMGTEEKYYAKYSRALAYGLTGSRDRKITELRSIIDAGQGGYIPEAMYELGSTYLSMERFREAITILQGYTNKYPASEHYLAALSEMGLAYQNLNDNNSALNIYKKVVQTAPNSAEARAAMLALRSIYVDMNDVDSYFAFAASAPVQTDTGVAARDSLTYVAAERIYLGAGSRAAANAAFVDYLDKFPRGAFRPNALYYSGELYLAQGDHQSAMNQFAQFRDMYYNQFTVRALEKLGTLAYDNREYVKAAEAYEHLARTAVSPQTVSSAWSGFLKSSIAVGGAVTTVPAADKILAAEGISPDVRREALGAKASALNALGERNEALEIYRQLATETQTAQGAEATYYVIEHAYELGTLDEAQNAIMAFAESGTRHSYWLGKAFLILGDIYMRIDDSFQARATWQSIVDGYSPSDDGIVDQARQRIAAMGN